MQLGRVLGLLEAGVIEGHLAEEGATDHRRVGGGGVVGVATVAAAIA